MQHCLARFNLDQVFAMLICVCFAASLVQLVACDSPAGRLGLSVCYQVRFPRFTNLIEPVCLMCVLCHVRCLRKAPAALTCTSSVHTHSPLIQSCVWCCTLFAACGV